MPVTRADYHDYYELMNGSDVCQPLLALIAAVLGSD
jgi:hypothetical protein